MLPGSGAVLVRAVTVVPVILLVLYAGLLGVLGLLCGRERRKYVVDLSRQALNTVGVLMHGPAASGPVSRSASQPSQTTTSPA